MTSLLNSQTTNLVAISSAGPSSAPNSRTGHASSGSHEPGAGSGTSLPHGHRLADTPTRNAVGDTNVPETNFASEPTTATSPAPILLPSQILCAPQRNPAGQDTNSQTTSDLTFPNQGPSSASNSPVDGQPPADAQQARALSGGPNPAGDHVGRDPQTPDVSGAQLPAPGQSSRDAQQAIARGGWLREPVLGILADVLDDLEKVRIANENRVRQLTRTEDDEDGENRGHGLTLDNPMESEEHTSELQS